MKCIIALVAIFGLVCATPIEKKEEKKEEKKPEERSGLQWPLPDHRSEGDLILHGTHFYDRVEELRKGKVDNDVDKMILEVGRNFLRKAQKYLEANPDFKITPVLCRDSREINSTRRWEIRIRPEHQPAGEKEQQEQANKDKQAAVQGEKPEQKPQNDAPAAQDSKTAQNDVKAAAAKAEAKLPAANATEAVNATEAPISEPAVKPEHETFEEKRAEWYRRMGENFARLLLKRFRKETLEREENEYLDRWLEEEAVHYGVMGIYCHEGENVKEIVKKIATYVEDKQ